MDDESSLTKSNDTHLTSKFIEDSLSYDDQDTKKAISKNHIINAICLNLEDIIQENKIYINYIVKDIFYLTSIPEISLSDYINRIMKYTNINISTLINAIIYIDIFCERKKYILCLNNIYLILLSACLLSIKFNEDVYISSKLFAKIGGIPLENLNELESYLYLNLHFSLFVKDDLYKSYYDYFTNYLIPTKVKSEKNI